MSTCATPIKGTHLRIVKLDECGAPVTGSNSLVVVTKGFIQVEMAPEYEDGEEFFERNADGQTCVNQRDKPTLKYHTLTVDLCDVNVAAASFVLDARLLTEGAAVTGTGFALPEGEPDSQFSLEVWQRIAGTGACDPSGQQRYIYNAWPNIGNTRIGTYTVQNGRSTMQFIGQTEAPSTLWDDGPGDESWLPTGESVMDDEHWLWNVTTTPLPEEQCGAMQLSS